MGGVRACVWVPQSASHRANPRHGAAPSSSPRVRAGRAVCAQRREAPGRAGLRDGWRRSLGDTGAASGAGPRAPVRMAGVVAVAVGTAAWGGARAGCESPQLPGTGVGPTTRECAARVSVRGRAPRARAASERARERTNGRAGGRACARRRRAVRGLCDLERRSRGAEVRKSGCVGAFQPGGSPCPQRQAAGPAGEAH